MKKRLACLITGVPRGYERCLPTLSFLLDEWDVTYFAVIREEFNVNKTIRGLTSIISNVQFIVIPQVDTAAAVKQFEALHIAETVVKMWHEIWYGMNAIPDKDGFDFIFRTRFDIFFHKQYLPEVQGTSDSDVWIPQQLSWSGSNDMLCLGAPSAFSKYAKTYKELHALLDAGVRTAEAFICRAMALNGIIERKLDVFFILYRDVLFSSMTDVQLSVLAHRHPSLSTYKLGARGDSGENRNNCIKHIDSITKSDAQFPLFEASLESNFFPPEIDNRDGSIFRWMGMHANMHRALPKTTCGLKFKLHFWVQGWGIQHLCILIDGNLVMLEITGKDEFGRLTVEGRIDCVQLFRRPWSKITFSSAFLVSPASIVDHRALSAALSDIEFMDRSSSEHTKVKPIVIAINRLRDWVSDVVSHRSAGYLVGCAGIKFFKLLIRYFASPIRRLEKCLAMSRSMVGLRVSKRHQSDRA